ncbi:MAG: hypothetical protein AVDCRST_MAG40-2636, partial [uncultured Gemmatimonadaceae bacterium]
DAASALGPRRRVAQSGCPARASSRGPDARRGAVRRHHALGVLQPRARRRRGAAGGPCRGGRDHRSGAGRPRRLARPLARPRRGAARERHRLDAHHGGNRRAYAARRPDHLDRL